MNRIVRTLLALLLCAALLPVAALASEGDAVLARRDNGTFDDYIRSSAAVGGTLYLLGGSRLYTWQPGQADLTAYTPDDSASGYIEGYSKIEEEYVGDNSDLATETYYSQFAIISWNGDAYILQARSTVEQTTYTYTTEALTCSRVVLHEDGTFGMEDPSELDIEPLIEYYGEDSYLRTPQSTIQAGDSLYMVVVSDMGDLELYEVPLNGGYAKLVEDIASPYAITVYTDGKILVEEYSYDATTTVTFETYDPATGTTELLCELEIEEYSPKQNLTADPATGLIYYTGRGYLTALDPATLEETQVNDFPSTLETGGTALMLEGGYFVSAGYEGVVVRNTDPTKRADKHLAICDTNYTDILTSSYFAFTNVHGDVSVAIALDYSAGTKLVEAMMNRSTQYDIYLVQTSGSGYNAVYTRGYMAPLDGSAAIKAYVDGLYPSVAEALRYNGSIVAIPVETNANTIGLNKEAMEKLGLTEEELPTDWPAFLDWIVSLAPRLQDSGVTLYYRWCTQTEMRQTLLDAILTDYQKYLACMGQELGYNTPVLRTVLEKLEAIDFGEFGLPEEIDWDNYDYSWDGNETILLETYVGASFTYGDGFAYSVPLLLAMAEDAPAVLQLTATVAFVNPYSQNQEEALAFLETMLDQVSYASLANLDPTLNEPTRPSYYAENLKNAQEAYAEAEEALAKASDEERQMYEEILKEYQNYLDYIENDMWEVGPQALEWYRSHDDNVRLEGYNPIYSDNYGEIYSLTAQYTEGSISLDQYLRSVDQKIQMMVLEGN